MSVIGLGKSFRKKSEERTREHIDDWNRHNDEYRFYLESGSSSINNSSSSSSSSSSISSSSSSSSSSDSGSGRIYGEMHVREQPPARLDFLKHVLAHPFAKQELEVREDRNGDEYAIYNPAYLRLVETKATRGVSPERSWSISTSTSTGSGGTKK